MIPLATSAITVARRTGLAANTDPADPADYSSPEFTTVSTGVRAVLSAPTANPNLIAGDRITYSSRLICDPTDLQANDVVTDDVTGTEWVVLWARPITAVGLDHTEAQLRMVTGFGA